MANAYVALALIAVLSITGGLYVLYQAKKYRRKQQSKWLADLVDKAIENSQRMEHDLEYRSEIQKRTR